MNVIKISICHFVTTGHSLQHYWECTLKCHLNKGWGALSVFFSRTKWFVANPKPTRHSIFTIERSFTISQSLKGEHSFCGCPSRGGNRTFWGNRMGGGETRISYACWWGGELIFFLPLTILIHIIFISLKYLHKHWYIPILTPLFGGGTQSCEGGGEEKIWVIHVL